MKNWLRHTKKACILAFCAAVIPAGYQNLRTLAGWPRPQAAEGIIPDSLIVKKQSFEMAVEQKAIEEYSKITVTQNDVITLIRKVYDIRDRYDTNGKLAEKNGIDKRDKSLLESKMGSRMLQWIYKAHENVFLSAIQSSVGKISTVKEVTDVEMLPDKEIFVLYGKSYIINVA